LLGEHLLYTGADALDLGVEALAGSLGGDLGWVGIRAHAPMLGLGVAGICGKAELGF
jgi:hypothetical protein